MAGRRQSLLIHVDRRVSRKLPILRGRSTRGACPIVRLGFIVRLLDSGCCRNGVVSSDCPGLLLAVWSPSYGCTDRLGADCVSSR
ncbi:uncharacterized protein BO80DRAFT_274529 [Aspergillus ibericus CBS 121593]|uniref:Uncharacterized protein n=1 Tax=Aspergillus ibericus CBS 121593 TaxID=1448316 RepID=A0A395H7P0_9EURO|nr:hypothetical protein BO80DRAFT_274529 [Aspergillus ibericus CBS 121593]RAL03932.1 hypothetical protein BO80DRAFT_274529 [Aspergillus ibericus CBS 121593]